MTKKKEILAKEIFDFMQGNNKKDDDTNILRHKDFDWDVLEKRYNKL